MDPGGLRRRSCASLLVTSNLFEGPVESDGEVNVAPMIVGLVVYLSLMVDGRSIELGNGGYKHSYDCV